MVVREKESHKQRRKGMKGEGVLIMGEHRSGMGAGGREEILENLILSGFLTDEVKRAKEMRSNFSKRRTKIFGSLDFKLWEKFFC